MGSGLRCKLPLNKIFSVNNISYKEEYKMLCVLQIPYFL